MELLAQVLITIGSFFGFASADISEPISVEIGIQEVSPKGEAGGFAVPASGCSPADPNWHGYPIHDCSIYPEITSDTGVVRYGEEALISWDPHTHINCVLSNNLATLSPPPDGTVPGSQSVTLTGETTFTITCDGVGNDDWITVKVLPKIQES